MHEQPIPVLMAFEPAAKGHGDHQAARHKKRGGLHSVGAVVQASAAEEVLTDVLVLFTCVSAWEKSIRGVRTIRCEEMTGNAASLA